ncbi:camkk meta protein kinase [Malassezia pachydermatis]|uniref:Camkk meta protein kinase n=1 Tax=Malassezia pachydermatis TaxID=77020 RepID=A0A0M9VR60_9BASI|nr:camkk meta protein kinase [Malassezia pachydermatis]KOS16292.1 camkk meta protein kinase [Malassezia pachydermatis]
MSQELKDGSRKINQYHILKEIGFGAFAIVHIGEVQEDGDHKFVAIKEFDKRRLRRKRLMNAHKPIRHALRESSEDPLYLVRSEVAIMKKLHHPHVLRLFEALDDAEQGHLFLVFEYCPGGPIFNVVPGEQVEPLPEEKARHYFRQVLSGIDYLHQNGVVHRDIKPENILLTDDNDTCKIVDFGVSEMFYKPGNDTVKGAAGSPAFMSPELCELEAGETHACPDDVWAFGVTLYCMVMGRLPFYKEGLLDLYHEIIHSDVTFDGHVSPACQDLLSRMLDKSVSSRITIPEIYTHPWVTDHGNKPMPTLSEIDKAFAVNDITEEDLQCAVCRISSMFHVARAVSKFKRAGSRHNSLASCSDSSDNSNPVSPGRTQSPRAIGSAQNPSISQVLAIYSLPAQTHNGANNTRAPLVSSPQTTLDIPADELDKESNSTTVDNAGGTMLSASPTMTTGFVYSGSP